MAEIYVAGRTSMIEEVRIVQSQCVAAGHTITHDWTTVVEEVGGAADEKHVPAKKQQEYAGWDMEGVHDADLVIMVCGPNLCGTLIEFGMALAWGKPIWIVGTPERESVFFHRSNVLRRGHIPMHKDDHGILSMALRQLKQYAER
jgi:nucleoside 2-deoxyribosyltransferase